MLDPQHQLLQGLATLLSQRLQQFVVEAAQTELAAVVVAVAAAVVVVRHLFHSIEK